MRKPFHAGCPRGNLAENVLGPVRVARARCAELTPMQLEREVDQLDAAKLRKELALDEHRRVGAGTSPGTGGN